MKVNKLVTMGLWTFHFGAGEHVQKGWVALPRSLECDIRLICMEIQGIFVFIVVNRDMVWKPGTSKRL